jgi:hypothetical protein
VKTITKRKSAVAAVAIAGAAALSGASALPGSAASTVHVYHLVAHQTASHSFANHFIGADTDTHQGHIIGYDSVSGVFHRKPHPHIVVNVAAALKGGFIYVHFRQAANSLSFQGTITGGTGRFAHITGTIRGHSTSQNSNTTFVTLRYRL